MCLGGGRSPAPIIMPAPQPAPPPPPPQIVTRAPTVPRTPAEEKAQSRPKTRKSQRVAAARGKTGKRRYLIPLGGAGGAAGISGIAPGVNA